METANPTAAQPLTDRKILLVEDDEFLSSLIKNRLEREKYKVTLVSDGLKAHDTLKQGAHNLILLDIILPNKLGFEILEELKRDPTITTPPVMIISNLGQEEDVRRAQELGAIDYFIKAQIMIDDLVARVNKFFELGPDKYQPE
ncbi:MAG: response regulator [bacterium]|nr:response regulator [bacterium]